MIGMSLTSFILHLIACFAAIVFGMTQFWTMATNNPPVEKWERLILGSVLLSLGIGYALNIIFGN